MPRSHGILLALGWLLVQAAMATTAAEVIFLLNTSCLIAVACFHASASAASQTLLGSIMAISQLIAVCCLAILLRLVFV